MRDVKCLKRVVGWRSNRVIRVTAETSDLQKKRRLQRWKAASDGEEAIEAENRRDMVIEEGVRRATFTEMLRIVGK